MHRGQPALLPGDMCGAPSSASAGERRGEHSPALAIVEILHLVWSKFEAEHDLANAKLLQRELLAGASRQGHRFDSNAEGVAEASMAPRRKAAARSARLTLGRGGRNHAIPARRVPRKAAPSGRFRKCGETEHGQILVIAMSPKQSCDGRASGDETNRGAMSRDRLREDA
jgi:hypothetical protein